MSTINISTYPKQGIIEESSLIAPSDLKTTAGDSINGNLYKSYSLDSVYQFSTFKNLEIEQIDGTKILIRVSFDDLSDIQERVLKSKKLIWKLPFPKYETTKTTYVSFHNKKDSKDYTAKCSLAALAKAFEVEYQSFGELLFDSALSGADA